MGHKLACQWLSSPSKLLIDSAPQQGAPRCTAPSWRRALTRDAAGVALQHCCHRLDLAVQRRLRLCASQLHSHLHRWGGVGWLGGKQADQGGWLRSLALHRGSLGRITAACMQSCAAIPVHPPHGPGGLPGWPTQKAGPQPGQPEPHRQPPGAPACAAGSLPRRSGPAARQLQGWEEGQWVIRGARRTPGNPQQARAHR